MGGNYIDKHWFGFWLFKNRLSGTIDLYNKYTNDLLFIVATSAFTNLSDRTHEHRRDGNKGGTWN